MDKTAAAARLGIPEAEVLDVDDSDDGVVIRTTDGQAYIDVPEDTPDAAGRSGLMFFTRPTPAYGGSFPVFTSGADTVTVTFEEPAPDGDGDTDGTVGTAELERVTEVEPAPAKKAARAKKQA